MRTLGAVRRLLQAEVSLAAVVELLLWLSIPHLLIGIVVTFVKPDYVYVFEHQLQPWLPAGAQMTAFGISMLLWPVLLIAPQICAA